MIHIDIDLFVALILFRIVPEVGERRVKQASANAVCVGYVVPLLFTGFEELSKVGPFRYIRLNV
jgi:hypothetical protein